MTRLTIAACALALGTSAPALADDGDELALATRDHRLQWRPSWRPFEVGDYVWTGVVLGNYLYLELGMRSGGANSAGPIMFDAALRDALRAEDPDTARAWATFSDVGWVIGSVAPWATSTIVPLVDGVNWRVGLELNLMNAQAFALTGFMARIGHVFVARRRPNNSNNASFPGGHAAGAFVGASLSCVHHLELGLFGHLAADVGWCTLLMGLATTTAIARQVADKHYATDTLAGIAVGVSAGLGVPLVFHYGVDDAPDEVRANDALRWTVMLDAPGEEGLGAAAIGYF
jgi:membrane-associated phospholipid phosphatase